MRVLLGVLLVAAGGALEYFAVLLGQPFGFGWGAAAWITTTTGGVISGLR